MWRFFSNCRARFNIEERLRQRLAVEMKKREATMKDDLAYWRKLQAQGSVGSVPCIFFRFLESVSVDSGKTGALRNVGCVGDVAQCLHSSSTASQLQTDTVSYVFNL